MRSLVWGVTAAALVASVVGSVGWHARTSVAANGTSLSAPAATTVARPTAAMSTELTASTTSTGTTQTTARASDDVDWTTLEGTALAVAGKYIGGSPLRPAGPLGPIVTSNVDTTGEAISVAQRTLPATSGAGSGATVQMQLVLLGDVQLVVDVESLDGSFQGAALVLAPGTHTVESVVPVPGSETSATAIVTTARAATDPVGTANAAMSVPLTFPGCYGNPQPPVVIGSVFGPLIQGEGIVECLSPEPLGLIVSIYQGNTRVGNAAGGTGTGTYLPIDAYAQCVVTSGTHNFVTAELYSVAGYLQGSATSPSATLHCA
ncbi:MAG: hypothetical protein M0Z95_07995 [Actinomycetota bacterium]|jgi:hypothetical protein|nr:hypothetical protein [Actinomycetota bacterium]